MSSTLKTNFSIFAPKNQSESFLVVSVVSGGENGGHEGRTSHGRIFT